MTIINSLINWRDRKREKYLSKMFCQPEKLRFVISSILAYCSNRISNMGLSFQPWSNGEFGMQYAIHRWPTKHYPALLLLNHSSSPYPMSLSIFACKISCIYFHKFLNKIIHWLLLDPIYTKLGSYLLGQFVYRFMLCQMFYFSLKMNIGILLI